ncbi:hypothetical protein RI367_007170 [Sorochytrium milnesiophthora]
MSAARGRGGARTAGGGGHARGGTGRNYPHHINFAERYNYPRRSPPIPPHHPQTYEHHPMLLLARPLSGRTAVRIHRAQHARQEKLARRQERRPWLRASSRPAHVRFGDHDEQQEQETVDVVAPQPQQPQQRRSLRKQLFKVDQEDGEDDEDDDTEDQDDARVTAFLSQQYARLGKLRATFIPLLFDPVGGGNKAATAARTALDDAKFRLTSDHAVEGVAWQVSLTDSYDALACRHNEHARALRAQEQQEEEEDRMVLD